MEGVYLPVKNSFDQCYWVLKNLPKSPGVAQVPDASQDCPVVLVAVCAHKGACAGRFWWGQEGGGAFSLSENKLKTHT